MDRFEAIIFFFAIPVIAGFVAMFFTSGLISHTNSMAGAFVLIVAIITYFPVLALGQFFLILALWFRPQRDPSIIGVFSGVIYFILGAAWAEVQQISGPRNIPDAPLFFLVTSGIVIAVNVWMASIVFRSQKANANSVLEDDGKYNNSR